MHLYQAPASRTKACHRCPHCKVPLLQALAAKTQRLQTPILGRQTTSGAGLDKAPSATDDLLSPQLHEDLSELFQATQAEEEESESSPIAAAEMIRYPAAETTAPPAATAAQTKQLSDQTGQQQPISGAAAGNEPQMTSQAQQSEPAQIETAAASQASDTPDSHVSSSEVPTAPATSNAGGLEWLVYNPPTTPGGALLAALRLWMINRTRNISPR